jgi:transcriptional regulator with XRE-family HTH domain
MRGAGDQLSIGERIAFYWRRRGLSQAVLADLVGRTEDWLSKIERGEREIRRLDVLADVARGLRVTLGDLLGEPVLMEDEASPRRRRSRAPWTRTSALGGWHGWKRMRRRFAGICPTCPGS